MQKYSDYILAYRFPVVTVGLQTADQRCIPVVCCVMMEYNVWSLFPYFFFALGKPGTFNTNWNLGLVESG